MPPDPLPDPDDPRVAEGSPGVGAPPGFDPAPRPDGAPSQPGRRRPPPPRLTPEALARARGGAREGLEWLGRDPEARASLLYRVLRLVGRFVLFVAFRFRIETSGQERLPAGGYLLIAAAHRGWMDPFLVMHALPPEPRSWFLGSAPSTFTSRWRERLIHRLGGLLPVWRGGLGVEQHVASARAVIRNGGVFAQMPEGTVSGPPGRLGPFRNGAALIALRTGAPIVPLAMAGTEELYVGRRMASEVLAPTSARELLGDAWDGVLPEEGSREELELARVLTRRLEELLGPAVARLYPRTVDPPGHPRRLRRRLTWLFLRPGRLDRNDPAG
ncbi:MAG TPA: lysophospholipid acyltransferase family protein [Candidatus Limnocylindrales bacterium]|nr:lysophospholipid acyltransferase family protein [Candidatus Limnocylindrales bacterium]